MAQLTMHELCSIEDKIKESYIDAEIARSIGKNKSVLSRLFSRYPRVTFSANTVITDRLARKSKSTASHARIEPGGELARYIHEKFLLNWSPEQIAGTWVNQQRKRMKQEETQEETREEKSGERLIRLSKDTIYDWVYSNYEPTDLKKHLRRRNKEYRDRKKEAALGGKYQMGDQVRIDERAKKYGDTAKRDETTGRRTEAIGHWEGDTIIGKDRSGAILTLVERKTGQTLIGELPLGKNAIGLTGVLTRLMAHIPKEKIKSITFDNGREFADHKMIQYELERRDGVAVDIYFAYPYHSWERGTNENTNGLIRQYIPKKTDFTNIRQKDLDLIQISLNSRPRKRLDYATPDQAFWGNDKSCVSE